jgi:hypothetical protein
MDEQTGHYRTGDEEQLDLFNGFLKGFSLSF